MNKDDFRLGIILFSFFEASRPVMRSNWPSILWEWGSFPGDESSRYVKLTINPHIVPSSRMLKVTSPHPHSYLVKTAAILLNI